MPKPQRNLLLIIVPCALVAGWLAFGDSVLSQKAQSQQAASGDADLKDHLQQAADAIVAVAKERVAAAKNDDEAVQRARLSDQALSIIGKLGEFDTTPQSDELLNAFRTSGRPLIVDAVIQLRLANELRTWEEMTETQHAAAINRFVSDVKKTGLTRGQGEMLVRVANMLGDSDDSKLLAKAVDEILPLARESKDAELKRIAPIYEGIQRRLSLPGKPLEIEGTLLSGSKINWESYRGKVVLVDFFASFCDPCRAEVPNVLDNYRAYHDKGFEVVGVNLDTNPRMCKLYMDQTGFNFPTIIGDAPNASGWDLPLARKYGITRIPRVILVDQNGNVVSTMARGERLGELLAQLLGPSDHPPVRTTSSSEDPSVTTAGGISLESSGIVPASAEEVINPIEAAPAAPEPPK
jgi:thiol-disulfide isomerase/thioredoxin